jgi:hypothetical protein
MHGEEHVGQGFCCGSCSGKLLGRKSTWPAAFPVLGAVRPAPNIFCVLFASTSEASVSACVCLPLHRQDGRWTRMRTYDAGKQTEGHRDLI